MNKTLINWGIDPAVADRFDETIMALLMIVVAIVLNYLCQAILIGGMKQYTRRKPHQWNTLLMKRRVFHNLIHTIPAFLVYSLLPMAFIRGKELLLISQKACVIYIIFSLLLAINGILLMIMDIYDGRESMKDRPMKGFIQVLQVLLFFVGGIVIIAIIVAAGLSANAYMEQVTSFSASLISSLSGDTAKAATVADMALIDMADNANKFGTDMESIQNAYQGFAKQNYTMLDNLKLGYGGTKEEMQRLLSDAQKLTGTKYDIDNLADVYNAIHAIQENLGVTGTTAKEASSTFSGSFSAMKAAAQNLLGNMAIGGDVTGSMKELVSTASTFLLDNAIPMVGRVITSLPEAIQTGLQTAAPKIKSLGAGIVKSLRDGIVSFLPSGMGGIVDDLFSAIGDFKSGFAAMQPQLASFGASVKATLQQVSVAVMPAITSIIQTVQTVIPSVLPVIQTVVGTIGQVISAAAPVIAGLVQGIGTVISTLAPVFQVIFDGIGQKVGSVLSFIGSKMGWIQEIISTVMPVVADILTTAWSVISPVIDIAISVFKVLFNVVQTVFNGIASVISSVWDKVKPIVEGIGNGLSWIADKVGGLFGFGGGGGGDTGSNAEGTNNWRGGPTWVGEQGPELIDLPRGTRILPNKESVQLASSLQKMREATAAQSATPVPANAPIRRSGGSSSAASIIQVTLAKLADTIVVREEADIDKIGEKVAKEVVLAVKNMVPVPA